MGRAMLDGFLAGGVEARYGVIKPSPLKMSGVDYAPSIEAGEEMLRHADIVFLAVKPQMMRDVLKALNAQISNTTLLISIAAGIRLSAYREHFPHNPIIRSLPNTPSAVRKGMNILAIDEALTPSNKEITETLFEVLGDYIWLDDEADMDAASALSASGPAFVFYFIEAMAKAGKEAGLSEEQSMKLARQTVIGAAALADTKPETSAADLRVQVTSAKGMTAAGLEALMDGRFDDVLKETIDKAAARSRALGKEA